MHDVEEEEKQMCSDYNEEGESDQEMNENSDDAVRLVSKEDQFKLDECTEPLFYNITLSLLFSQFG